jgi:hypothetical protein
MSGSDTLLPLTTGSSLAVQFSSYGDLPAVIHIGRKVPVAEIHMAQLAATKLSFKTQG